VKDKVFLEEFKAAIIFKHIAESVQYLNELGLIHCDFKPENVMVIFLLWKIQLNQEKKMVRKVKLIDFGFAIYKKKLEIMPED
jgi:serine/threonine protein kinase